MKVIEQNYKFAYPLVPRTVTTHLILHHAAGNGAAMAIHNFHLSKGWAGIAYHYYVTKKGEIYRGRPENMRGGHTTNWNYCSIGICFEGSFDSETMSQEQMEAGRELVADIKNRYPPIVVGAHREFGLTACPGKNFPFAEIAESKKNEPTAGDVEEVKEPDLWAKEACEWAVENGIYLGDEKNDYHWHKPVTRQELALILYRLK